jgi:hypothetical protein
MGEAIGLEALHAATFVVDANEQVATHGFDGAAQPRQLCAILPVAGKQDDAADQRVFESLPVDFAQVQAGDVNDERCVLGHEKFR